MRPVPQTGDDTLDVLFPDRKYPCLSTQFLKGSFMGQIKSAYKTRDSFPGKLEEFKLAIAARDIDTRQPLTPAVARMLFKLDIVL
jgi:hypothetical protein